MKRYKWEKMDEWEKVDKWKKMYKRGEKGSKGLI